MLRQRGYLSEANERTEERQIALRRRGYMVEQDQDYMAVAKEILRQLGGGNRLVAMVGAKNITGFPKLQEKEPWPGVMWRMMKGKDGINAIRIALAPDDTYTIIFAKTSGVQYKEIDRKDGIYADVLKRVIADRAGLALSL